MKHLTCLLLLGLLCSGARAYELWSIPFTIQNVYTNASGIAIRPANDAANGCSYGLFRIYRETANHTDVSVEMLTLALNSTGGSFRVYFETAYGQCYVRWIKHEPS